MLAVQNPKLYKSGAAQIVDALRDLSVTHIFGYPGASVLSIYNELAGHPEITHCLCRHEQACVHAAEGYARITGKPGVVLVTSGPGATNTVTGIANAYADSVPLVIIAGMSEEYPGKGFQKIDFSTMVKPVVKKIFTPDDSCNIYDIIKEAFYLAIEGKNAPVLIQVKRSLLEHKYESRELFEQKFNAPVTGYKSSELVSLINNANNPVFIIGGGCRNSFNEVSELVSKTNIPTVTTLMGVGNIDTCSNCYYGMIGVNGVQTANDILLQADLIVAFGVAFSDRTTCKSDVFAGGIPVINVNIEPYTLKNVNVVKEINEDCRTVLNSLINSDIHPRGIQSAEKRTRVLPVQTDKMETMQGLNLINEFSKPLNPVVITDVGQHQMLAAKSFEFTESKRFLTSGGMGTMGFGLPASCGVHFALPETVIINITGDGSFQMNIQELATVAEYNIPVKIFVMNNGYLGMIRQIQEKLFDGNYYQSQMKNPDFIKLAEGYGIKGYRVTKISELKELFPAIFANSEPVVIDCITNEFECV